MNLSDLTNWLTSSVDTPVSLTAKLKSIFNTAKSKLNVQAEKISNIISTGVKDVTVQYNDCFTDAQGKVFKINDIADALVAQLQDENLQIEQTVTSIDGSVHKLDDVIASFNEQNASCGLMQALMSGCECCPTVSDLMRYVENTMGTSITELSGYAQSALVDFQTTVGQTYNDTNPKARVVQICNWVKNRLKLAIDSQTTTMVVDINENNYTGVCVAAAFLNLIDVEGIIQQTAVAIINSIKVLASAIFSVIDKALSLITRGIAKFIQAGSNCAYIQLNDKYEIDSFDIPCCQVKFSLTEVNSWTDCFPSVSSFRTLDDVFTDGFFSQWQTFEEFKQYLSDTYQVNTGFELEINSGYIQIFRYDANYWVLRVFTTPCEPAPIYKSLSGGGYWYNGLKDTGSGATIQFNDFTPAEYLEAQLSTDPSLTQKSNNDWDQMYTAYALYKGTIGAFNRMFASTGSMVLAFANPSYFTFNYLSESEITNNYSVTFAPSTTEIPFAKQTSVGRRVEKGESYFIWINETIYYFTTTISGHITSATTFGIVVDQSTIYANLVPALNLLGRYRPNNSVYKYIGPCFSNQFENFKPSATNAEMLNIIKLGISSNLTNLSALKQVDDYYYSFNDLILQMMYLLACTVSSKINNQSDGYTVGVSSDRVTYGDSHYVLFTDADALKRYSNMVGIITTAIAVVIVIVVAIIITKKIRTAFYVASAARDTASFNLGQAIIDGNTEAIEINLLAFNKYRMKTKLLSLLISGSAVAVTNNSSSVNFASMAKVSADDSAKISDIITLIRG